MTGGHAGGPGKRSMVVALLVTLAAPMLAYASVRNAAIDAVGSGGDPSAVMPPRNVAPRIKAVMRAARRPETRLPASALPVARTAAAKTPLAYEPYYIAARVEEQAGRYGRATALMEEARRRRPSSTAVHVALLGYYSLANAYQKAIDEADLAMRINGGTATLILPAFAKLVALDAKARQAIAVALAKNPPWRDAFLSTASTAKMEPNVAKALVADIRRLRPSTVPGPEEAFLVRSLVEAGKFREARSLWESYSGRTARSGNVVVDPSFRGLPSMQPFAWTFHSGQDGTAEIGKNSGDAPSQLEIDYFGDTAVVFAEQTLSASPGRYRLSSLVTGSSSASDIQLSWMLTCLPSKTPIGQLQLQPLQERSTRMEMPVTIPAGGCEGQSLALLGQPGDISRTLSAQIAQVSLAPAGAPRSGR